jgi:hypothetical protein
MKRRLILVLMVAAALGSQARGEPGHCTDKGAASAHVAGPHGLEGWTIDYALPDSSYKDECFAGELVIARNGHVIRRFNDGELIWQWMFWKDGEQVAFVEGPLHFGAACVLKDLKTGREIGNYDCYHDLPKDAPEWVKVLEALRHWWGWARRVRAWRAGAAGR